MKKRTQKRSPSIVLAMMVRNERHVIRRAIESALPVVSGYFIVDTGSVDDTVKVATEALARKPGEIISRPWGNYGHNRSELLALAKDRGDWLLLLDADEVLETVGPMVELAAAPVDGYELPEFEGSIVSSRLALIRASRPWSYVGELREVLVCEEKHRIEPCAWGRIVHYEDGAESQRDQYERRMQDAEAFRAILEQSPHDACAAFYAAESLRLAGDLQGAIETYDYRVALGGHEEETFWALFQIAKLHERRMRLGEGMNDPVRAAMVAGMYLRAFSFRPSRAEPLVELARFFGDRSEWGTALMFSEAACALACVREGQHPDRFSVDSAVVHWRARDALALSCFSTGNHARAADSWAKIIERVPEDLRDEVQRNLDLACETLDAAGERLGGVRESLEAARKRPGVAREKVDATSEKLGGAPPMAPESRKRTPKSTRSSRREGQRRPAA